MTATPFEEAQARLLERYGVEAESRFFDVPAVSGSTHVLLERVLDALGNGRCPRVAVPAVAR